MIIQVDLVDVCWQVLEFDFFGCYVQLVVQVWVVWNQFFYFGIGFGDVFWVVVQCCLVEGIDVVVEQWMDVGWYEVGEIEGIGYVFFQCYLLQVVVVVYGWYVQCVEVEYGVDVVGY